tara:strand:+ start:434 stop:694 length:261 start_codon:yes stop_codon:yes gene_type:complete
MISEAILKINPNAKVTVSGSNLDTCTIEWLEGTAEISKTDIQTKVTELETEIANAEADAITKKASGKQKLLDLGLSEEEIKSLLGV